MNSDKKKNAANSWSGLTGSALFFPVYTSHGVQQIRDLVDILLVSHWGKLEWKTQFTHSWQSGCWKWSVRWVTEHGVSSVAASQCSVFIHLLSPLDTQRRTAVSVYNCTCHIFVIVQALYVAVLRIVQLAFSIKPCPPTEIGPTSQTSLYNH